MADRNEKLGLKIREGQLKKIPYLLVVGDKEMEKKAVAVRNRVRGDLGGMSVDEFKDHILQEISNKQ